MCQRWRFSDDSAANPVQLGQFMLHILKCEHVTGSFQFKHGIITPSRISVSQVRALARSVVVTSASSPLINDVLVDFVGMVFVMTDCAVCFLAGVIGNAARRLVEDLAGVEG